jgi:ATP-dependent DNA helicase RecG
LRADAFAALHRPRSLPEAEVGPHRLAFDELLVLRLGSPANGRDPASASAQRLGAPGSCIARYRASLPFTLTADQERAMDGDRRRISIATVPMQRLLQGDVGSGKTVVALHALLRAVEVGRQGALMAPTETLAEQHFLTIDELCAPLGVRVTLLTSSLRAKEHAPRAS